MNSCSSVAALRLTLLKHVFVYICDVMWFDVFIKQHALETLAFLCFQIMATHIEPWRGVRLSRGQQKMNFEHFARLKHLSWDVLTAEKIEIWTFRSRPNKFFDSVKFPRFNSFVHLHEVLHWTNQWTKFVLVGPYIYYMWRFIG